MKRNSDTEPMSKKLNALIPDETWEDLEEIANAEMRTKSQMAAILLGLGIVEYRRQHPADVVEVKKPQGSQAKRSSK